MRALLATLLTIAASPAMAQEATATTMPQSWASLLPLVVIFMIFYFLLIRPQQRRFREHQAVLSNLKKGDMVVTGGGKIGKVLKVVDDVVQVELAPGVEVKVLKSTISGLHGASKVAATETKAPAKTAAKKKNAAVKNDNIVPSKEDVANDN
jgi:preprotein translocase subunit YajC